VTFKKPMEDKLLAERTSHSSYDPIKVSFGADSLKKYSFGFRNLLAALFWVDLLQNQSDEPVESGKVSWEFSQLNALTTLDPHFIAAYEFGAVYLSVLRRDNLGAKLILEKWSRRRPYHWRPLHLLGYHLYYEMGQYEAASEKIMRASTLEGAPFWLASLGIRILSETGARMHALRMAIDLHSKLFDRGSRARLRIRVMALNFALQESAWKKALTLFRAKNKSEPANIEALRALFRGQTREIASLFAGTEISEELRPLISKRYEFRYNRVKKDVVSVKSTEELGFGNVGVYRPKPKNGG